jgi:hypothetical protein
MSFEERLESERKRLDLDRVDEADARRAAPFLGEIEKIPDQIREEFLRTLTKFERELRDKLPQFRD